MLKLPRTIADLAGADAIQAAYLAEAIHLQSTTTASVIRLNGPIRWKTMSDAIIDQCADMQI